MSRRHPTEEPKVSRETVHAGAALMVQEPVRIERLLYDPAVKMTDLRQAADFCEGQIWAGEDSRRRGYTPWPLEHHIALRQARVALRWLLLADLGGSTLMRRPTETQAARIEAKIERLRADATAAFFKSQYSRNAALSREADALEREYRDACGLLMEAAS